ncbi:TAP-like protein-domain-containing protein [Ganoderma leucocontextum]|nr:TAP-like protein-domain-containing protein [Ganoderma leucocontextum]
MLLSFLTLFFSLRAHGPVRRVVGLTYSNITGTTTNTSAIQWGPCDPSLVANPSLSCGFFEIPLDYNDSLAGKGRIAVIKANATGDRRGTFFMNPGGPGVSGLQALDETSELLRAQVGGSYDIVSWDPRGIGSLSVPGNVACFENDDEYNAFWEGTIQLSGIDATGNFTDQSEIDALLAQANLMQQKYWELGVRCQQHSSGKYLKYMGTAATVRDLLALADALDGPGAPVNYVGLSYGTILGSWLVNMFPERVGHILLDGVVDPDVYHTPAGFLGWPAQLLNSDDVYKGLITACALAGPDGCTLTSTGDGPLDVNNRIQDIIDVAHSAEATNSSSSITPGIVRTQLFWPAMYAPSTWMSLTNETLPQVAQQLKSASLGSGNVTKRFDLMRRRSLVSLMKRAENSSVSYTTQAILCGDAPDRTSNNTATMRDVFDTVINTAHNVSHMFGTLWPNPIHDCAFWPERAVERYMGPFNKTLANRILVIGNTYDPVTPFVGAKKVADGLGDSATLVRMNGFGHTSQAAAGQSTCINNIIHTYLVNSTLPEGNDTVCEVDDTFQPYPGVTTSQILASMPRTSF